VNCKEACCIKSKIVPSEQLGEDVGLGVIKLLVGVGVTLKGIGEVVTLGVIEGVAGGVAPILLEGVIEGVLVGVGEGDLLFPGGSAT